MERVIRYQDNGLIYYSRYNDWDGNPVKKTKEEYSYSYDAYVLFKDKQDYKSAVYSDRLYQHDHEKYNRLCKKHFNNEGQYWNDRSHKKIESFLQDFYDKPKLKLVGLMQGCNVSNGYPYWIFMMD